MDLETVRHHLTSLEHANGVLLPGDVLNNARDPESPLHPFFTWDDSEAAEKCRLLEARQLIRRVRLEVVVRDVPLTVARYVRDPETEARNGAYRDILKVRNEADLARATVIAEMQRVSNAAKRARSIAAVLGLQADLDAITEIANGIVGRVNLTEDTHAGGAA